MPQPALEFTDICYSLPQKKLLAGFCLSLETGEKVILCGPSGCGKSTLLKLACGLTLADSGQIRITGDILNDKSVWHLRQKICYMQQESPVSGETVRDYLLIPFSYRANEHLEFDENRVNELAAEFLLKEDILKARTQDLSGGERQRTALISAIILQRSILLLDETCAGLDPESAGRVVNYLRSQKNITILAVAHDPIMKSLSERVLDFPDITGTSAKPVVKDKA